MTTPAMTEKDRAMPNNSDQAAMHDELRARHAEVLRELLHLSKGLFPLEKLAIKAAIAALSMPVSETVAWAVLERENGRNRQMPGPNYIVRPLVYTTQQPAPAAMVEGLRSHEALCAMQAWLEEEAAHAESSWIDTLQERYEDGDDVPDSGHYVALWLAERLPDQLTALLSGGAAREGANGR